MINDYNKNQHPSFIYVLKKQEMGKLESLPVSYRKVHKDPHNCFFTHDDPSFQTLCETFTLESYESYSNNDQPLTYIKDPFSNEGNYFLWDNEIEYAKAILHQQWRHYTHVFALLGATSVCFSKAEHTEENHATGGGGNAGYKGVAITFEGKKLRSEINKYSTELLYEFNVNSRKDEIEEAIEKAANYAEKHNIGNNKDLKPLLDLFKDNCHPTTSKCSFAMFREAKKALSGQMKMSFLNMISGGIRGSHNIEKMEDCLYTLNIKFKEWK